MVRLNFGDFQREFKFKIGYLKAARTFRSDSPTEISATYTFSKKFTPDCISSESARFTESVTILCNKKRQNKKAIVIFYPGIQPKYITVR